MLWRKAPEQSCIQIKCIQQFLFTLKVQRADTSFKQSSSFGSKNSLKLTCSFLCFLSGWTDCGAALKAHILYGAPISCETEGMKWGAPTCSAGSNNNQLWLFTDWKTIWIPMALNQTRLFPVADDVENTLKAVICDFLSGFLSSPSRGSRFTSVSLFFR